MKMRGVDPQTEIDALRNLLRMQPLEGMVILTSARDALSTIQIALGAVRGAGWTWYASRWAGTDSNSNRARSTRETTMSEMTLTPMQPGDRELSPWPMTW